MSPSLMGSVPVMAFMVVVLPAPLEPISDTSSPSRTSKVHALDGLDTAVGHFQALDLQQYLVGFFGHSQCPPVPR
jgi:hypothetical protein